jgi:hypothetical protein
MLIEKLMPDWEWRLRHERVIAAPKGRVWLAARQMTIRKLLRVRVLLWVREVFSRVSGLPLETFPVVAETEGEEVVRCICGRFWAWRGNIDDVPVEEMVGYEKPGSAKAYWNFHLEDLGRGQTRVVTETRVKVFGEREKRWFGIYWKAVGPFAGWIRGEILREVEREALR